MVVNQMLLCFGTVFAMQDTQGKAMLLGVIEQSLKSGKKQIWHAANVTNICVGLLAGLKALLSSRSQALEGDILSSAQAIFLAILSEGEISVAQRRASAEGLGLLARLGNDIFTAKMTRQLLSDLVGATDSNYIGSIALSLGCIHRSAGGMALSTLVPATVSSVSSLAKSLNADLQAWSLHSLLLTVEAAGLSYVSYVQATLILAMDILLSEENGRVDLRQAIGRLVNAIVAVLGPELSPGSTFFSRCKSVVAEISSGEETSTLLEFTQQLVLFAPQAVSVHSHVRTLLPTLFSRQPTLRHLAVSTLKHLIEKDPASIIDEEIEAYLFGMLDEETDTEIANLVRSTIKRLYYTSCPSRSSRWIGLFRSMVLVIPTRKSAVDSSLEHDSVNDAFDSDGRTYLGEDDEGMITSSCESHMQLAASDIFNVYLKKNKHLRYRTRIFAAECLSYLPTAVGNDPAHFDVYLAKRKLMSKGHADVGDWLVLHTQDLVALAYQVSTSQFENMQSIGVGLLCTIMDKFGNAPDLELPGHLLMEQYQAQLVSAVRTSLATFSSPLLLEAGLQLATKILTSTITRGDRAALQRMFSLITHPLNEFNDIYYPSFAEWVACKIKIRLLEAHASVKCYTYNFLKEQHTGIPDEYESLLPMISKCSTILGKYWIRVLEDYSFLCFGLQSRSNYKPFLDGIQSSLVSSKLLPCLNEVWPVILQAVALDALPAQDDIKLSADASSRKVLLSGYSMSRLELKQYHFVWGFSVIVLFQSQQKSLDKQVIPFSFGKSGAIGDSSDRSPDLPASRLCEVALLVLDSLSVETFFSIEFLTVDLCRELLEILLYLDPVGIQCCSVAINVVSQIVKMCPQEFFKNEEFTYAAMEVCLKFLYQVIHSTDQISKDKQGCKDLISALFVTAGTIAHHFNSEKQWKLDLAILSVCYECCKGASTIPWFSALISIVQNTMSLLRKRFKDKANFDKDSMVALETVFGAWQNEILQLSQFFIKSIQNLGNKDNSCKLLLMKLAFCLEEAVSLARLANEAEQLSETKDKSMFFCAIYQHCINCIHLTLSNSDIQIQIIGLNVLKSTILRELGQDQSMQNQSFILFTIGELLGDIFFLIEKMLKRPMSKESITVGGECLRLLVHLHALSQGTDNQKAVLNLLLEGIITILSTAPEDHPQELTGVKSYAMRLVSQLAQIPSSAIRFRDILLEMPATRRQQLQDIIRASVVQGQNAVQTNPATTSLIIRPPVHIKQEPQVNPTPLPPQPDMDNNDEEDDWDAFQSFPATDAAAASQVDGTDVSPSLVGHSSNLESNDYSQNYAHVSSHHPVEDNHSDEKDLQDFTHCPVEVLEESSFAHGEELRTAKNHGDREDVQEIPDLKTPEDAEMLSTEELSCTFGEQSRGGQFDPSIAQNISKLQPALGAEETNNELHSLTSEDKYKTQQLQHLEMGNYGIPEEKVSNAQPLKCEEKRSDEKDEVDVVMKTMTDAGHGNDKEVSS